MSGGGVEIGRISIKVTPDTDGFRRKVVEGTRGADEPIDVEVKPDKKSVAKTRKEIEKGVSGVKATVKVDKDQDIFKLVDGAWASRLKQQLREAVKPVNELRMDDLVNQAVRNVNKLDKAFADRVAIFKGDLMKIDFEEINRRLERELNPFDLQIHPGFEDDLRTRVERGTFEGMKDGVRQTLEMHDEFAQIKVKLDNAQADLEFAQLRAREAANKVQVVLDPVVDEGAAARAKAWLKALFNREKVKIDVDLDYSFFDRMQKLFGSTPSGGRAGGIGLVFQEIGERAAAAASGFRAFGVGAGVMLAIAALIPPALALIAGGLTILPAAFAAITAPIATVIAGFDGIKKAAENAGLIGSPDKKGKSGIGEKIQEIKDAVSKTFEDKLTGPFKQLISLTEPLKAGLPVIAGGLSDIAGAFIKSITSAEGMEKIKNVTTNIGTALSNAAPGVGKFTDGLLSLVDRVATRFPGVGTAFANLGDQFNRIVDNFIRPDTTGVSDLDRTLKSLHDTWNQVAGLFTTDLIGKGFDFIKDPAFGSKMESFVGSLRTLVQETIPALAGSFSTISDALEPVAKTVKATSDLLDKLPSSSKENKEPAKPSDATGSIPDWLPIVGTWDDWLAKMTADTGKTGQASAEQFNENFKSGLDLGGGFDIVNQLAGQGAAQAATESADKIIDAFKGSGNLGANADIGAQLSANIKSATDQATAELQGSLGRLSTAFQTKLAEVGTASRGFIEAALAPLQQAPALVMNAFQGVGSAITGSFATAVSAVAGGASQIAQAIGAGMAQIPGAVQLAFANLGAIATGGMTGMVTAVVQGCAQVIAALQPLPGQIAAIGSQLFSAAQSAGAQVGAGMAAGITASTGQAVAAAQAMAAAVTAASQVKLGIKSPSRVFADIGDNVGKGFVVGVEGQSSNMIGSIKQILEAVKEVFGSANGLNLNFNLGAAQSSMAGLASSTKDFTNNLTESVSPTKALTEEGKMQLADLQRQLAELEIQRKELKVAKDAAGSKEQKAAIQAQIDQIQSQKNLLSLEKDKLSYAKKYGEESWNAADALKTAGQASLDAAFSFGKANIDQLQSDLGIGGGAITGGANALWDWGTKAASNFIFNVSNVDEAIAVKNNQVSKQAMQFTGR